MLMQQNEDYVEAEKIEKYKNNKDCLPISAYVTNFIITVKFLESIVTTKHEYGSHTT
jgi:hypothetical protein